MSVAVSSGPSYGDVVVGSGASLHQGNIYVQHHHQQQAQFYPNIFKRNNYRAFKDANPLRVRGTCQWVFNHPHYLRWLHDPESPLLWVSADPGCGKSVLARSIVDERLGTPESSMNLGMPHLFHFFKDAGPQKSAVIAICSLLHQLYSYNDHWSRCYEIVAKAILFNGWSTLDDFHELWSLFIASVGECMEKTVVCVFDALDECEPIERQALIQQLDIYSTHQRGTPTIKFLITSRPYFEIMNDFRDLTYRTPTIHLAGEDSTGLIRDEIDLVIDTMIERLASQMFLTDRAKMRLSQRLRQVEHRTYLWLSWTFKEIQRLPAPTERDLLRQVDAIPDTVEELYERLLIRTLDPTAAKQILALVTIAYTTLTLTELELLLQIQGSKIRSTELEFRGAKQFAIFVRNVCGLFLMIVDQRINLIHQTAKDFLLHTSADSDPLGHQVFRGCVNPAEDHPKMAMKCMLALKLANEEHAPTESVGPIRVPWEELKHPSIDQLSRVCPALRYPLRHWIDHLRECERLPQHVAFPLFRDFVRDVPYGSRMGRVVYRTTALSAVATTLRSYVVAEMDLLFGIDGTNPSTNLQDISLAASVCALSVACDLKRVSSFAFQVLSADEFRSPVFRQIMARLIVMSGDTNLLRMLLARCARQKGSVINGVGPTGKTAFDHALDLPPSKTRSEAILVLANTGARATASMLELVQSSQVLNIVANQTRSGVDLTLLCALMRAGLDFFAVLDQFVVLQATESLAAIFEDSQHHNRLMSAIANATQSQITSITSSTQAQRSECAALITQVTSAIVLAVSTNFFVGADTILKLTKFQSSSIAEVCSICFAFRTCRYNSVHDWEKAKHYFRKQAQSCRGLGPILLYAGAGDIKAMEATLRSYENLRHSCPPLLSITWSLLTAVAHDRLDIVRSLQLHAYSMLQLEGGNQTLPQEVIDACEIRDAMMRIPETTARITTSHVEHLLTWTLRITRLLMERTEISIRPEDLFNSEAVEKLEWCLDYLDEHQSATSEAFKKYSDTSFGSTPYPSSHRSLSGDLDYFYSLAPSAKVDMNGDIDVPRPVVPVVPFQRLMDISSDRLGLSRQVLSGMQASQSRDTFAETQSIPESRNQSRRHMHEID